MRFRPTPIAGRLAFWTVQAHFVDALRVWFRPAPSLRSVIAGRFLTMSEYRRRRHLLGV